ncbi:hypothetical protein [uncultured Rubinisphaera sp.]
MAANLRKRKRQMRWPESSYAKLEQTIMLGFYSIRKLHESTKLSNSTMDQDVPLIAFPATGKLITIRNWHHLDSLYKLEAPKSENRKLLFICHQFIHSYVFSPVFDNDDKLEGVLFASDRQRNSALLQISIDQIAQIFEHVGNDYPSSARYVMNYQKGDYDVFDEKINDLNNEEWVNTQIESFMKN